jgi:hypothetical protein
LLKCLAECQVRGSDGTVVTRGSAQEDIPAQRAHRVSLLRWGVDPTQAYTVDLLLSQQGNAVAENHYHDPFHLRPRPSHYPWSFDPLLGMRC